MTRIDSTSLRILSLLRDRPLASSELAPLLEIDPESAKERVNTMINDGLVIPLAGSLRTQVMPAGQRQDKVVDDDDPLTLTFRGMLNLK